MVTDGVRTGGRVLDIKVREGDAVAAGQALITLEPGELPTQLVQARAQLVESQPNLEKLQKGARPEELAQARARSLTARAALDQAVAGSRPEEVGAAEARLTVQQVAVEKAQIDAARMNALAHSESAAQVDVDNADMELNGDISVRVVGARFVYFDDCHDAAGGAAEVQMLFLPSIFLSGYLFPLNGMPLILKAIGELLPTTHMVAIMRGIVLRDAGPIQLMPHVLALVAFAVIMTWLSVRRVSKISV